MVKKIMIRVGILLLIFFAAVFVFGRIINRGEAGFYAGNGGAVPAVGLCPGGRNTDEQPARPCEGNGRNGDA